MSRFGVAMLVIGAMGVGSWWSLAADTPRERNEAAPPAESPVDPAEFFMRAKLRRSQQALEGLVTEDFDRVRLAAEQMQMMSRAAEWAVIEGPEYRRHSAEFRRLTQELADAARKQNGDAATLAYLQVTLSCVNCHKFVRSVRVAEHTPNLFPHLPEELSYVP